MINSISRNAKKKYKNAKVEKIYKNNEGVYGVVLYYPRKRAVPLKIKNVYNKYKKRNSKLKMDENRQIVFFNGTRWADETNLAEEVFFPGTCFFQEITFSRVIIFLNRHFI